MKEAQDKCVEIQAVIGHITNARHLSPMARPELLKQMAQLLLEQKRMKILDGILMKEIYQIGRSYKSCYLRRKVPRLWSSHLTDSDTKAPRGQPKFSGDNVTRLARQQMCWSSACPANVAKSTRASKSSESDQDNANMKTIKEQLSTLMELVPVVAQLTEAYDNHLDLEADDAAPDNVSVCDASKSETGGTEYDLLYFESLAGT